MTPELFENIRKYRFSKHGIRNRKEEEEMLPDFRFLYNATTLLEQKDMWCDISEDLRTSPEINFAQFQKEYKLIESYYTDFPD